MAGEHSRSPRSPRLPRGRFGGLAPLSRAPRGGTLLRVATGRPLLVLVPTHLERLHLAASGAFEGRALVHAVGAGPLAAAANAALLATRLTPARVLLAGIAGSYDLARAPLGSARFATRTRCLDLGALPCDGSADGTRAAPLRLAPPDDAWLVDDLELALPEPRLAPIEPCALLTVHAASGTREQAEARARAAQALLEDMEGHAVAMACRAVGVPCSIARGVSNAAGDRDHARWAVEPALVAVRELALEWCGR
jgi:futalosine hydrolase